MDDIRWEIKPRHIEWEMDWTNSKKNGHAEEKPDKEMIFEPEMALAHMLMNDVVFLNDHWWEKEWPEDARKRTSINVNCNDVFAWGCADAESMLHDDIEQLYRMWRKDPTWGAAVWCMIRRNQMPQKPVEERIRSAGVWDLDALRLGKNTMDAEVHAYLAVALGGALTPA